MVRQYPYTLMIPQTTEAVADTNGNYHQSDITWIIASPCRDEANLKGNTVILADTSTVVFDSIIQLPRSCPVIEVGMPIKVMDGSTVRIQGTTLRFSKDQLHCRLWV